MYFTMDICIWATSKDSRKLDVNLPALHIQKCVTTLESRYKLEQQNPYELPELLKEVIKHSSIWQTKSPTQNAQ